MTVEAGMSTGHTRAGVKILNVLVASILAISGVNAFALGDAGTPSWSEPPSSFEQVLEARTSSAEVTLLSWFEGSYFDGSWIVLHLDSENSIQISFVTLDTAGGITGYTLTNYSVAASAVDNVNSNLAYFNWSLSNGGQTCDYVYKFTRTQDAYGDPQVNLTGYVSSCSDYTVFNNTQTTMNCYTDSGIDVDWWLDTMEADPIYWGAGDATTSGYHGFLMETGDLVLTLSNSCNFYPYPNAQTGNTVTFAGYISILVNDESYADDYDFDGRLRQAFKVVTPKDKERYGNALIMLPWYDLELLEDMAANETIYSRAAEAGITHVYVETWRIDLGEYTFWDDDTLLAIQTMRDLAHKYGMEFVLPCYFWAFTSQGANPISSYDATARTDIIQAWGKYLVSQGWLTDEYSIGYCDLQQIVNYGFGYWNFDMLEEAIAMIPDDKDVSFWGHSMWWTEDCCIYLNDEGFKEWGYDSWDSYYEQRHDHDPEPGTEMAGMKTWSLAKHVAGVDDESGIWTEADYVFEARVIKEAFHHGSGLSVFYNETFYADRDGFSLAFDYLKGLVEDMIVTAQNVPGLVNGTMYEDEGAIMLTGDEFTLVEVSLDHSPTTYIGAQAVDTDLVSICTIGLSEPYPLFISSSADNDTEISLSSTWARLYATPGELYAVLPITVSATGTATMLVHSYDPNGSQIASWAVNLTDTVTFSLTLSNTTGYQVLRDGDSIFSQRSGGSSEFSFATDESGEFVVRIWKDAAMTLQDSLQIIVPITIIGLIITIVGAIAVSRRSGR